MHIDEIPIPFLQHERFELIAPSMSRVEEMQRKKNEFGPLHHEFLLWSPGFHSLETVKKKMGKALDNFVNDINEYIFLIICRENNTLLGCISLFIRNVSIPYYEIGYWLATDAMGRGIMTEACKMATNIASVFFKAKKIEIRTAGRNERSQSVALKSGFSLEARLINDRLDSAGVIDDTLIYRYHS
ncbi:GNAT family N-acetyltransferase [Pantoea agglomerans]